jgi:hypothetical protein
MDLKQIEHIMAWTGLIWQRMRTSGVVWGGGNKHSDIMKGTVSPD